MLARHSALQYRAFIMGRCIDCISIVPSVSIKRDSNVLIRCEPAHGKKTDAREALLARADEVIEWTPLAAVHDIATAIADRPFFGGEADLVRTPEHVVFSTRSGRRRPPDMLRAAQLLKKKKARSFDRAFDLST